MLYPIVDLTALFNQLVAMATQRTTLYIRDEQKSIKSRD